ncbi:S-methyl-5'-thioadenosine phosphorylase [Siculibacillus lacustris]|uniref:S-methyl-5'-thioadenosine phosphorylase n=1 Tax=Siculibacillus lacustris TaxID=1549641 RepID=A0A4Q9VHW3_9HYPH|nr:S-methyl-5'-thioadenosine phosphorylase [Siculibacillus lacustris]TBW34761.1 S-methyl-5'-thioadenosine phosphorylase [Siculibacillus lacustris]
MAASVIGVIGGSGLYDLPGLVDATWTRVDSPWGTPSDELLIGTIGGNKLVFLPRHGRGHRIPPSEIDYRANIDALKRAGVTDLVSISAVGSYREDLAPGTFVLIDQFVDRTVARASSFFGTGCVGHVGFGHPVSPGLMDRLKVAALAEDIDVRRGGTYVCMEGPQFSTLAESLWYKSAGFDVIGMTNMPEAKLAREAELPYATVAMVTDYDCWHPSEDHVDVASVIKVVYDNADKARRLIARFAHDFPAEHPPCPIGSDRALDHALMTAHDKRDPALLAKLDAVAGRVLNKVRP